LIGGEGEQLGIVAVKDALGTAREKGLDLVEVSPNAKPPVCRIMDYGKYYFDQVKSKGQSKKKQKRSQVKELKYSVRIEEGDFQVKLRNLIRFIENGDKVKISLRFRGREMTHQELGMDIMKRIQVEAESHVMVEQVPKLDGRQIIMVLAPKKK
jgi:translation initiation factor IF-3